MVTPVAVQAARPARRTAALHGAQDDPPHRHRLLAPSTYWLSSRAAGHVFEGDMALLLPRLAYKPEHALDLDTGAIIVAELHEAEQGDTASLPVTLEAAAEHLAELDAAPIPDAPAELIADKGYHSRDTLKRLADGPWKTPVSERRIDGVLRWHAALLVVVAFANQRPLAVAVIAVGAVPLD
jgi:hypothetical protein